MTTPVSADARKLPVLMTPAEVASALRVDPKTVTRWATTGKLPSIRTPGGHRRYRREDVDALLRSYGREPTSEARA